MYIVFIVTRYGQCFCINKYNSLTTNKRDVKIFNTLKQAYSIAAKYKYVYHTYVLDIETGEIL